jgi:hypothetical protein
MTPWETASASPVIAYRGLWDKFGAPGSLEAARRAYRRGVPSLVRVDQGQIDIRDVAEIASTPRGGRHPVPVYVVGAPNRLADLALHLEVTKPTAIAAPNAGALLPPIFWIAPGSAGAPWPLHLLNGSSWIPVGSYLPISAALKELRPEDLRGSGFSIGPAIVLVESLNVIEELGARRALGAVDDHGISERVRRVAGPDATVLRVSDLAELDQLDQIAREAA